VRDAAGEETEAFEAPRLRPAPLSPVLILDPAQAHENARRSFGVNQKQAQV